MSLIKSPAMTESKLAANKRNAKLSQGATSEEGKARLAAAQTRHGLYAKSMEFALDSWGEDPAEFAELLEGLWEEFSPAGALQPRLVTRLAQVLWTIERAERRQEGEALRRAQTAARGRENRLHARMMRLQMTAQALRRLARSLAVRHYVTTPEDLEVIKKLHQDGAMGDLGEIAVDLFYQLQEPGTGADGESQDDKRRRVVNSIRSIFGLSPIDSPVQMRTPKGETLIVRPEGWVDPEEPDEDEDENGNADEGADSERDGGCRTTSAEDEDNNEERDSRYPSISAEDWRVRERARKLLKNLLTRQVDSCETERKAVLRESLAGPSPFELAAENAPSHAEVLLMRRVQDSNMREVRKLTNLLLKLKREERLSRPLDAADEPPEGRAGLEPGPFDFEPDTFRPPEIAPGVEPGSFDPPEAAPSHLHGEGPCRSHTDGPRPPNTACRPQTEGRGGSRTAPTFGVTEWRQTPHRDVAEEPPRELKNEGKSHDVVENTCRKNVPLGLSHDVKENTALISSKPRCSSKQRCLAARGKGRACSCRRHRRTPAKLPSWFRRGPSGSDGGGYRQLGSYRAGVHRRAQRGRAAVL